MSEEGESGDVSRDEAPGKGLIQDQDRFLPIANVGRIMKREVPEGGKIAKDAKECVQECVSEFISFVASEASERCQNEKRKTINGEDVLAALGNLGFDSFLPALKTYLTRYRDAQKGDKATPTGGIGVEDDLEIAHDGGAAGADAPQQQMYMLDPSQLQGTQNGQFVAIQTPNGLQFVQLVQAAAPPTLQPAHSEQG